MSKKTTQVDRHMRFERECHGSGDVCHLTIAILSSGKFRARLSFQTGMGSASADGDTVEDALSNLDQVLGGAA
jgi:hypothetical protein